MSSWTFDRVNINGYQTPPQDLDRTCIPPPAPGDSHVPKDLRSTSFAIGKHPKTDEVVKEVNKFFLDNWPFRTDKHRKRFVNEGYAWFMCITCPMSRNDRIHWGCRLLTLGFLIDDLLDRMSVEEGVTHNSKVIECARGHTVPDPAVPAQWIMYDLFEGMRTIDKHLADELLELTIEFLVAQADGNRMKPMTLQEYFDYRFADLGKGYVELTYCLRLKFTG